MTETLVPASRSWRQVSWAGSGGLWAANGAGGWLRVALARSPRDNTGCPTGRRTASTFPRGPVAHTLPSARRACWSPVASLHRVSTQDRRPVTELRPSADWASTCAPTGGGVPHVARLVNAPAISAVDPCAGQQSQCVGAFARNVTLARPSSFRMGASPLQASADELHAVPVERKRESSRDGETRASGGDGHTE
jgi:hypothetical protein